MAVVHDLAEAVVGDIAPSDHVSKEDKGRLEAVGCLHNCGVRGPCLLSGL
jgi:putative hydrolase of HD superfamily